jgi:aryl-alcohol dehydrogenase
MRADQSTALTDGEGGRVGSHFFGQSSFASHAVVSHRSLVKVDPGADLTKLGPLGCGIQTGAGAVFNSLEVEAGASLVVAGAGTLGLAAVMAAKVAGAGTIIAVDRHASRLELASRYGATHTVSGELSELTDTIIELTGGGADYAFDSTGNPGVVSAVLNGLSNTGVLGMAGVHFGPLTLDFMALISSRTVKGVIEGDAVPQEFIPRLIELNEAGQFPFDELITTYPFSQINEAEAASLSGAVIKPVLVFD